MGVQRRQPTGIPRPHQWLLMGVQACRLPAPKPLKPSKPSKPLQPSKPLKPSQGHIFGNRHPKATSWLLMGTQRRQYSYPKARSIASSGRCSVPFARHAQPTGIPRPHQWLLMGVEPFSGRSSVPLASVRSQQASQGHINGFLWASKLAVCQPLNPSNPPNPPNP